MPANSLFGFYDYIKLFATTRPSFCVCGVFSFEKGQFNILPIPNKHQENLITSILRPLQANILVFFFCKNTSHFKLLYIILDVPTGLCVLCVPALVFVSFCLKVEYYHCKITSFLRHINLYGAVVDIKISILSKLWMKLYMLLLLITGMRCVLNHHFSA